MIKIVVGVMLWAVLASANTPFGESFYKKAELKRFVSRMHSRHHFDTAGVWRVLRKARFDKETLARYQGRFKKGSTVGSWERFKLHIVNKESFQEAKSFKQKYRHTLQKAARIYHVDEDYIVGFMGVESHYGTMMGQSNILDALVTLAFYKNRMQRFFKRELEELFLFARERNYQIEQLKGSFAGAMGCVQQLPSVARRFNSDFDGDGASVWDIEDCIGSIAKFMHHHHWDKRRQAAYYLGRFTPRYRGPLSPSKKRRYSIGQLSKIFPKARKSALRSGYLFRAHSKGYDDMWVGGSNAKAILRYNNSSDYVLAIEMIAQSLKH